MDCKRVTVIRIGPVISTRKKSTVLHKKYGAFLFYQPFTLATPFVKNAFVALRRVRQTRNVNNLSSAHGQSAAETILNRFTQKKISTCGQGHLMLCLNKIWIFAC